MTIEYVDGQQVEVYETTMFKNGEVVYKYPGSFYAFKRVYEVEERMQREAEERRIRMERATRFWGQLVELSDNERVSRMRDPMIDALSKK